MTKKPETKFPLSPRAALLRINRRLASEGKVLKATRAGSLSEELLGRYFLVSTKAKGIIEKDLTLTAFGQRIGALQPWEEVQDD